MTQNETREPIMKIRHLTKEFKIKSKKLGAKPQILHALSDVSLDVYEGETLGIIGESGCGKSTLGRTIIQLHKATSGSVEYQGKDLFTLAGPERQAMKRDIQMVFQDPYSSLDPRNTCETIIAEPLKIHQIITDKKERQDRVLQLMREVGLDIQHMNRYPHEFSGGQRQRINVARALSLNPKIIICDEPVSALDVSIQAQVLNLFNRLQREHNLTYIFISHDLGVIKHVSDRIAIMYLGRVVELCEASQIYTNPLHPYTQALLSAIPPESPFEKKERIVLKGEIPSPIGDQVGCPLAGRCPHCTERCTKEIPELKDTGDGHQVACFLYH
ncbi:peptide ABC transporter ATP-binding protein [Flavonifractor sp. An92]|uniref:ABC transporter ATP-binding protein n=1 Tax=Flavonifractor sp. An92 TaxID=1965666 RepID=UPI000B3AD797|nr:MULTISPECIES: oligopeptide/dipeptide ABC transporter ATP-binding protein [unclassified Flavonifractor]OUN05630.1 peptide ABC transporter ATP-binding protein [Flavonifractor sp. An92]OUQ22636.1 peptide ABC transporter ATP-binding protein [Flavonifractor sp. An135]